MTMEKDNQIDDVEMGSEDDDIEDEGSEEGDDAAKERKVTVLGILKSIIFIFFNKICEFLFVWKISDRLHLD